MKRVYAETMADLAGWMQFAADSGDTVAGIFYYDEMCKLLEELIGYTRHYYQFSIDLHSESFDGYDGEYLLTITDSGTKLYVEKAKHEEKYLNFDADVLVLSPDANIKAIPDEIDGYCIIMEAIFGDDAELTRKDCDFAIEPSDDAHDPYEVKLDCNGDEADLNCDDNCKDCKEHCFYSYGFYREHVKHLGLSFRQWHNILNHLEDTGR